MGLASTSLCAALSWIFFFYTFSVTKGALSSEDDKFIGCFKDEGGPRSFRGLAESTATLTPQECTRSCYDKGFLYSATQGRTSCFCGDKHPNPNSRVSEDRCSKPCAGNPAEKCGSETSLSVRKTGIPDYSEVDNYLGCFDDRSRLANDVLVFFHKTNTPRRCMNYCLQLGHKYSGVQYGRDCFCGNKPPDHQHARSGDECNWPCPGDPSQSCGGTWRIALYSTNATDIDSQTSTEVGRYLGCYKDLGNPGIGGRYIENINDLTLQKCTVLCYEKGFLYSWTQSSTLCFCGDKQPDPNTKTSEDQCSMPCAGNKAEMCGGETSNSFRETGIPDFSEIGKYVGCFDDHSRLLEVDFRLDFTNSPKRCMNLCLKSGYHFSGVQYGRECKCGSKYPDRQHARSGDECRWPCTGDPRESCGGNWRMAIYSTNVTDNSAAIPLKASHRINPCVQSATVVNGKTVCRGDVIFEDSFSVPLSDKWQHVNIIPGAPDYEFNVFHADKKNSFTSNGKLVIKPTVYEEAHVLSGSLELQGCTAPPESNQCGYTAFSYRILPPVASARINTKDSFSFRYGKVEIRAKLPVGDWLVPELWLEPKDHYYGPHFASGRVRLAMSRGNSDLRCEGKDMGFRQLESGVMMGPNNKVRQRSIITRLPENWNDHFHNYTLMWKPGSISFKIDNEEAREIVGNGKRLCEVLDSGSEECLTWSLGSKLAPIDQDFYISVGLSVANKWDFPDNCINRGKPKPWRNEEVKAMLKFWQDRGNWHSTWTEDGSSLYIDHVRVTAL